MPAGNNREEMKIKEILAASRQTLISFELLPPLKGGDIGKVYNAIEPLMEFSPSFINLTYHRDEEVIRQRPDGTLERVTWRWFPIWCAADSTGTRSRTSSSTSTSST